jgi:hypothetical protein
MTPAARAGLAVRTSKARPRVSRPLARTPKNGDLRPEARIFRTWASREAAPPETAKRLKDGWKPGAPDDPLDQSATRDRGPPTASLRRARGPAARRGDRRERAVLGRSSVHGKRAEAAESPAGDGARR